MENEMWNEQNNGYHKAVFSFDSDQEASSRERSPSTIPSSPSPPPKHSCIEHSVSKLDTLVGIAIKYGVEVADIKKMNGLITDHQMFALKTIHIPLPGRHPPSPCLSYGFGTPGHGNSNRSSPDHAHYELFELFQSLKVKSSERKVSPAMSSLQGYYGLKATTNSSENGTLISDRPLTHHRKSKSLVNVILEEIMEKVDIQPATKIKESDSDKWKDKLVQRRQKSEADFRRIPELLLKEDNGNNVGPPSRIGKRLAMRPNAASRIALTNDSESNGLNPVATSTGDALLTEGSSGVRKSSSTSCLQDQDNICSSSIWPTSMWSLKPDLQVFPKPIIGRRNKAALD